MNITDNAEKIAIVERLVKDGAIDFAEAMKLLEEPINYNYFPPVLPNYPIITFNGGELATDTN